MINIAEIVQSSRWKKLMAKLYGWGASIVIIGALFKIQHWPMAGLFLTIGLLTEAVIFFFSAFEPLHEEVDWTLVYPELAGMGDDDEIANYRSGDHKSALEKFDSMIEKAEIGPAMFEKLGQGLSKLNQTTASLSDVSDASIATNEYVSNVKAATSSIGSLTNTYDQSKETLNQSIDELSGSYQKTADLVSKSGAELSEHVAKSNTELASTYQKLSEIMNVETSTISQTNKSYNSQLESLNKNLSALNAAYELQLHNSQEQLKDSEIVYKGVGEMMTNLKDSIDETKQYREEINKLNKNLSALNNIYGNMLSAMSVINNNH